MGKRVWTAEGEVTKEISVGRNVTQDLVIPPLLTEIISRGLRCLRSEAQRCGATADQTAFCAACDNPVRAGRERQGNTRRERQGKADVFGDVSVLLAAGTTTGDGHGKINSDAISI